MVDMVDMAALLDALPDGVVGVDLRGEVLIANAALLAMTGFSAAEVVGQPIDALVPEAQRGAHARRREGFSLAPLARPMNNELDTRVVTRAGSDLPVAIQISPIQWQGLAAFVAVLRPA